MTDLMSDKMAFPEKHVLFMHAHDASILFQSAKAI